MWIARPQVGDTGAVEGPSGSFTVEDTRVAAGYVLHVGRAADGAVLRVGDSVTARCGLQAFVAGRALQRALLQPLVLMLGAAAKLRCVIDRAVPQKTNILLPTKA